MIKKLRPIMSEGGLKTSKTAHQNESKTRGLHPWLTVGGEHPPINRLGLLIRGQHQPGTLATSRLSRVCTSFPVSGLGAIGSRNHKSRAHKLAREGPAGLAFAYGFPEMETSGFKIRRTGLRSYPVSNQLLKWNCPELTGFPKHASPPKRKPVHYSSSIAVSQATRRGLQTSRHACHNKAKEGSRGFTFQVAGSCDFC